MKFSKTIWVRVGFRVRFFWDPESHRPYFGLDRKIPKILKSRGSGSGFENSEKIPSERSRNFFFPPPWIFIPGIFRIFYLWVIPGIFYPRYRDFFSWDGPTKSQLWSGRLFLSKFYHKFKIKFLVNLSNFVIFLHPEECHEFDKSA